MPATSKKADGGVVFIQTLPDNLPQPVLTRLQAVNLTA
jgi:hypothetical protein